MKIFKRIILLLIIMCIIPMQGIFAVTKNITVSGSGMISGDGVSFDTTEVILPKASAMNYTVNIAETSLYRVLVSGTFNTESVYNISVDSIIVENVSVFKYSSDKLVFYISLSKGQRILTFNTVTGRAMINGFDLTKVSAEDTDMFVSRINGAKTAQEVKKAVYDFDEKIKLCVLETEKEIFFPLSVYDRLAGEKYGDINEFSESLFAALFAEKNNPAVKLSENGTLLSSMKDGLLDLTVRRNGSGNETYVTVYDEENRLFYVNKFTDDSSEDFNCSVDLRGEEKVEDFKFKIFSWNSDVKMSPEEKFSGIHTNIYMSASGSDSADGSIATPFKTLGRVKEEIKKYNSNMQGDIVVHIMSGTYFIEEEQLITDEYSGTNGYRVIFRGEGESKPVFTGGKEIKDFTPWKNGIYKASYESENEIRELFVNGIPAVRAKSEWKYKYLEDYDDGLGTKKKIVISQDGFIPLSHPEETELVWEKVWVCQRTPVEKMETINDKTVVTLSNFYQTEQVKDVMVSQGGYFYVENAPELVDEPGEFCYSKAEKAVYYYPYEDEDPNSLEFFTPETEKLLRIKGTSVTKKAENISFENISFKNGAWFYANEYPLLAVQAGAATNAQTKKTDNLPEAHINIDYADNIEIRNCTFESMGATAICFEEAATNIDIVGNVMKDIGGSAISIGTSQQTGRKVTDERILCKQFNISNNVIRRTAFQYRQMPALTVYYANGVNIENNDMKDTAYSGISAGWGWDSTANINKNSGRFAISGNKISRVLWSVTDGGNIYTLGHLPDSVIKENYFDSNLAPAFLKYPGIYLDEGSTYISVLDNVVTNCKPRWLLVNNSDEDIYAEISGNYTDGTMHSNKSITPLGENFEGLTEFPQKAKDIMANAGVLPEYRSLLSGVEISDDKVKQLFAAPKNEYYEGILVNATSFFDGAVTDCGETYVSFNTGNYMRYNIEIPESGTYNIDAYVGVDGTEESKIDIKWKIEEQSTTYSATATYTGGYGKYEPFALGRATLDKGTYTLWVKNNGGAGHVKKFILTEYEGTTVPATSFYDGKVTDKGTDYVSFNAGNYMYYNVDIPKTGTYELEAYVGVGGSDTSKKIEFAWQMDKTGTIKFANVGYTGGYGKYEMFSLGSIYLTEGSHILWLKNNSGGCHVNKLVFK